VPDSSGTVRSDRERRPIATRLLGIVTRIDPRESGAPVTPAPTLPERTGPPP
jgi:hypothetical protein